MAIKLIGISSGQFVEVSVEPGGGIYRDLWIGAGAMTPRTTNGAAPATVELATNDVMLDVLDFDTTTEEGAGFAFVLPTIWDLGTVKFKVYWTAASGSDGVAWGLRARASANDDAMDAVRYAVMFIKEMYFTEDSYIAF